MKIFRLSPVIIVSAMFFGLAASAFAQRSETGVLLMAHGGDPAWNKEVQEVAAQVDSMMPTEVAFGMADRDTLQAGIAKLTGRGVKRIVAVPLFISSHSSVIESIRYLLGLRPDAPKDLAMFAAMGHDMHGMEGMHGMADMKPGPIPAPIQSTMPVRMTQALDHHPIVADILVDRAAAISKNPKHEALLLVAHGPNEDSENALWLADMADIAKRIGGKTSYERIETATVRDDAGPAVKEKATAELRQKAEAATTAGDRVLIVPLLLSYGGIENGLRQRLDGVDHVFSPKALLPDPRIAKWVLDSAQIQPATNAK